jgi:hypothetical protein
MVFGRTRSHQRVIGKSAGGLSSRGDCRGAILGEPLRVVIAVADPRSRDMRFGPDMAHLFTDVLAKVGNVEEASPIVEGAHKLDVQF